MALPKNEMAVVAFREGDPDASRQAHDKMATLGSREPHTQESGDFIKNILFGGLDGIVTSTAIVSAVFGANYSSEVALTLGFANLLADGLSMGFSEYLSSRGERSYIMTERAREEWEMKNYPEGEKAEMVEIYTDKHGFSKEDAELIIGTMSKNEKFFIDHMCVEELGLMPPDDEDSSIKSAVVTFVSFIVFGVLPLISYLIFGKNERDEAFALAASLTAFALVVLGVVRGRLSGTPIFEAAGATLFTGAAASVAAFLVSWGLSEAVNADDCL